MIWDLNLEMIWFIILFSDLWNFNTSWSSWLEAHLSSSEQKDDFDDHAQDISNKVNIWEELNGSSFESVIWSSIEPEHHDSVPDKHEHFFDNNEDSTTVHEGFEADDGEGQEADVQNNEDGVRGSWLSVHEEGEGQEDNPSGDKSKVVPFGNWVHGKIAFLLVHEVKVVTDTFSGAIFSESDSS